MHKTEVFGKFEVGSVTVVIWRLVANPSLAVYAVAEKCASGGALRSNSLSSLVSLANVLGRFDAPHVSGQKPRAVLTPRGPQKSDLNSYPREFLSTIVFVRES